MIKKKRYTTENRWLIDIAMYMLLAVWMFYMFFVKNGSIVELVLFIADIVWVINSICNYFKSKKGIAIEVDGETLKFVDCCVLYSKEGKKNIGDMEFSWAEVKNVDVEKRIIQTKDRRKYSVNDHLGWLDRTKVWRTIKEYSEIYRQ